MLERAYPFARKALFRIDAERAHNLSLRALRAADRCGLLQTISGRLPESEEVQCMGLTFPNRVGLAAGLDKEGNTIDAFGRLGFGFRRLLREEEIGNRCGTRSRGCRASVPRRRLTLRSVLLRRTTGAVRMPAIGELRRDHIGVLSLAKQI